MPKEGGSDLEKQTAAQAVGKVDAADPSLAADRLGVRIQRDGFERPFAGTKPEPEAEEVGNAVAFGLLLQVVAGIGVCFLKWRAPERQGVPMNPGQKTDWTPINTRGKGSPE